MLPARRTLGRGRRNHYRTTVNGQRLVDSDDEDTGKTHVTVAGREEGKAYVQEPPKQLTLKVIGLTHLTEGCAGH